MNHHTQPRNHATTRVLSSIWGRQEGHVAILRKRRPTDHTFTDKAWFSWPNDRHAIYAHTRQLRDESNVFFTPYVYRSQSWAAGDNLATRDRLCLDLDTIDPASVPQALQPAVAWRTSPGRYQGVWLLDSDVSDPASIARALARALHCPDGAGAGSPKPLRLPASLHDKGSGVTRGELLWCDDELTDVRDLPPADDHTPGVRVDAVLTGPTSGKSLRQWRFRANNWCGSRHQGIATLTKQMLERGFTARDCYDALKDTPVDKWPWDPSLLARDLARLMKEN